MKKPFIPMLDRRAYARVKRLEGSPTWPMVLALSVAFTRATRGARSPHRHRKAGRA